MATSPRRSSDPGRQPDPWLLTDLITRLRRVLRASIRADYPWETLPMAQVEILQRLADEPNLRVSELAERHRLARNTVSTLIHQMVTSGLVSRHADERDRRAATLNLTALGRTQLAGWQQAHTERLARALTRLAAAERSAIGSAMPALARLVEELESEAAGRQLVSVARSAAPARPLRAQPTNALISANGPLSKISASGRYCPRRCRSR